MMTSDNSNTWANNILKMIFFCNFTLKFYTFCMFHLPLLHNEQIFFFGSIYGNCLLNVTVLKEICMFFKIFCLIVGYLKAKVNVGFKWTDFTSDKHVNSCYILSIWLNTFYLLLLQGMNLFIFLNMTFSKRKLCSYFILDNECTSFITKLIV